MLIDKNIEELAEEISDTKKSVPAGGTTIASSALLSVSLLELVIRVSKKEYSDKKKEKLKTEENKLINIKENLLKAIDDDAAAFRKNSDSNFKNLEDLKEIVAVPLSIAESAAEALTTAYKIEQQVKKTVKADYQISKYNLQAAVRGAISIIEANYNFFPENNKYIENVRLKIKKIKDILKL